MISKEDFEIALLDLDNSDYCDFFTENMNYIYHYYLKDEWFSTFAKPVCGMYLYYDLDNIRDDIDMGDMIYCITKYDLFLALLIFIYNCLEYEDVIDIEELYSAALVTFHDNKISKKTLDIHYLARELEQSYQEIYNNMLYVFNMEEDVVKIEFYKYICPAIIDYVNSLLDNQYIKLLVIDKNFAKHHSYGDNDNTIDWWGRIPGNRYKSLDEKLKYFCSSLGGD